MKYEDLSSEEILKKIILDFGIDIVYTYKLSGIISDLLVHDKKTRKMLLLSIKEGIPQKMVKITDKNDRSIQSCIIVHHLVENAFLAAENAKHIISLWSYALGWIDIFDGNQNTSISTKKSSEHNTKKYTSPNGDVYIGEWLDGKKDGQGKMTYSNGDVYDGEWKDDKINGKGKITYSDGSIYEGELKDDKYNGQGKYTWPDGYVYEGEWKDDKRNGYGKLISVYGVIYEEKWIKGKRILKGK